MERQQQTSSTTVWKLGSPCPNTLNMTITADDVTFNITGWAKGQLEDWKKTGRGRVVVPVAGVPKTRQTPADEQLLQGPRTLLGYCRFVNYLHLCQDDIPTIDSSGNAADLKKRIVKYMKELHSQTGTDYNNARRLCSPP